MVKKLKECNIGDFVRIWCIGYQCWDDEVVKITEKGILITVQYPSGQKRRFSSETICTKVS